MKRLFIAGILICCCLSKGFAQFASGDMVITKKERPAREYIQEQFVLAGVSFNRSQLSYTFGYGQVKKWGWYGKVKTDFHFDLSNSFETHQYYSKGFWNGKTAKGRLAASAGVVWNMTRPVMLYAGAGYGWRWKDWETIGKKKIRIKEDTFSGIETELGIMVRWERFLLTAGATLNTENVDHWETDLAIGYAF